MDALMASGFITPPSLHYVRNHGAVPKIDWSAHRLTINGLVDTPITLTMDELIALPSVTLPVTLVCAGNRCVRVCAPVWPCVRYAQAHCCQHTQHARVRFFSTHGATSDLACSKPLSSATMGAAAAAAATPPR